MIPWSIANRWAVFVERSSRIGQIDPFFTGAVIILPSKIALYFRGDITEYEQLHAELTQVYIRGETLVHFYEEE
ncbi:hypothetical protein CW304_02255 [Bacillus sp. UFRGS-B20]|nr:hypothetical protein CW304_02255 [Bacillus sp. UFRGS-B20]